MCMADVRTRVISSGRVLFGAILLRLKLNWNLQAHVFTNSPL